MTAQSTYFTTEPEAPAGLLSLGDQVSNLEALLRTAERSLARTIAERDQARTNAANLTERLRNANCAGQELADKNLVLKNQLQDMTNTAEDWETSYNQLRDGVQGRLNDLKAANRRFYAANEELKKRLENQASTIESYRQDFEASNQELASEINRRLDAEVKLDQIELALADFTLRAAEGRIREILDGGAA